MKSGVDAILLRAFIREDDKYHGLPLYEVIVLRAREMKLAGATLLRGPLGFGRSNRIHTAKILRLSFELPIVVEIIDTQQRIDEFLPVLDELMTSGIVTLEKVALVRYPTPEQLSQSA
jgi:uncharacterized protein